MPNIDLELNTQELEEELSLLGANIRALNATVDSLANAVRASTITNQEIRGLLAELISETQSQTDTNGTQRYGFGEPASDEDPQYWNLAALNGAIALNLPVYFEYVKPVMGAESAKRHVIPNKIEAIGSGANTHYIVTANDLENGGIRNFRLDRIEGYVTVDEGL